MDQRGRTEKQPAESQPSAGGASAPLRPPYMPRRLGGSVRERLKSATETGAMLRGACRTDQERTFVSVLELARDRLERMPTLRELRASMMNTPLEALSKDRLRQILLNLNKRLPPSEERVLLTTDRAFFREQGVVAAAYQSFRRLHQEPPTVRELKGLVHRLGHAVTDTSLTNILKHLRKAEAAGGHSFSVSRRRKDLTAGVIRGAHQQAVGYLEFCGIKRQPSVALIQHYLRARGYRISHKVLTYRLKSTPSLRGLKHSSSFDPADYILPKAHRRLSCELNRPPTAKELAAEFNLISLVRASPDAVWMRAKRLNRSLGSDKQMGFSVTFGSGIYDHDLLRVVKEGASQLRRAPTLNEVQRAALDSIPGSNIALDTLHRRLRRLKVGLTSEHTLTKQAQRIVTDKIQELRTLLGRRPFGAEVREALRSDGHEMTREEFARVLGSAKRHRGGEFRRAVILGFPSHLGGKLRLAFDQLRKERSAYPSAEDLARALGWARAGVVGALPTAQQRAAKFGFAPVLLAGTPEAEALEGLASVARNVVSSVAGSDAGESSDLSGVQKAVRSAVGDWVLPALPYGSAAAALSVDEKLLRCELWWVLVSCLKSPPWAISEDLEIECRVAEAQLAKRFGLHVAEHNPFDGFLQVLRVARESGRLSAEKQEAIERSASSAENVAGAHSILRPEVQQLAARCGFPRLLPESWRVRRRGR